MKPQTIESFEAQARAAVEKQKNAIGANLEAIENLEKRLTETSKSPSQESIAEAVKLKGELLARRSIADDCTRNFREHDEFQKLLNTQAGADVLKQFLAEKTKVIAGLKSKIAPLRKNAMEAELAGKDEESFALNEKADNIAATVSSFEVSLAHASAALDRFHKQIDGSTSFQIIAGQLHQIIATA